MTRTKFVKAFMLGVCVSALSTGVAFAETVDNKAADNKAVLFTTNEAVAPDANVSVDDTVSADAAVSTEVVDDKLIAKQDEVNKILFEDKINDIESKDIAIMNTTPVDGAVEVGILPYTKENIDYIYSIIGEDKVNVVEGKEPELMATSGIATDGVMTAAGAGDVKDAAEDGDVKVVSVADNSPADNAADNKDNNLLPIVGIAGVAALLGGAVIISQKKKTSR